MENAINLLVFLTENNDKRVHDKPINMINELCGQYIIYKDVMKCQIMYSTFPTL